MEGARKEDDEMEDDVRGAITTKPTECTTTKPITGKRTNTKKKKRKETASTGAGAVAADEGCTALVSALQLIDPFLRFLTRATGEPMVSFSVFEAALPSSSRQTESLVGTNLLDTVRELAKRGVLSLERRPLRGGCGVEDDLDSNDESLKTHLGESQYYVGFPLPRQNDDNNDDNDEPKKTSLHGSSLTASKRRLAALRKSLRKEPSHFQHQQQQKPNAGDEKEGERIASIDDKSLRDQNHKRKDSQKEDTVEKDDDEKEYENNKEAVDARRKLRELFRSPTSSLKVTSQQAAYAGCRPGHSIRRAPMGPLSQSLVPMELLKALGVVCDKEGEGSPLYSHQSLAIESAFRGNHTVVCTGTGSGKSLCYLIPILTAAYCSEGGKQRSGVSLLLYPTKALAQDQFGKLMEIIERLPPSERHRIRPGVLDGDTHRVDRRDMLSNNKQCNLILTNPDTLHAAVLPGCHLQRGGNSATKNAVDDYSPDYRGLLSRLRYVVLDEAHVYSGNFGAHVSLVLSRLVRLHFVASSSDVNVNVNVNANANANANANPKVNSPGVVFLASSATLENPLEHFRALCPVSPSDKLNVVDDDGSPRGPKYFFVWNPPWLHPGGNDEKNDLLAATLKNGKRGRAQPRGRTRKKPKRSFASSFLWNDDEDGTTTTTTTSNSNGNGITQWMRRRHPADETAMLLATAARNNVRCIAFARSRRLVEWVYDRAVEIVGPKLSTRIESYRGGYQKEERRRIEADLFSGKTLGVVATSALELGVDVGGVDLILHLGHPGSRTSLLQQAGRAGRGGSNTNITNRPSFSLLIVFPSAAEQHLWSNPSCLLSPASAKVIDKDKGNSLSTSSESSIFWNPNIVRGHLLCASHEFPLTGSYPVTVLTTTEHKNNNNNPNRTSLVLSDHDLFGSMDIYKEALRTLLEKGVVQKESVPVHASAMVRSDGDGQKDGKSFIVDAFKAHGAIKSPWSTVSIRSIEPLQYRIVDLSHPSQNGRTDGFVDEGAVLDTVPYSRVFYHAFPGAIVVHRTRRYRIETLDDPPMVEDLQRWNGRKELAAYARPTQARYLTVALRATRITVVKRLEQLTVDIMTDSTSSSSSSSLSSMKRETVQKEDLLGISEEQPIDLTENNETEDANSNSLSKKSDAAVMMDDSKDKKPPSFSWATLTQIARNLPLSSGFLAGNGVVTVKRQVWGYRKLSAVTRAEISKHEISMPAMEYDTNALWFDVVSGGILPQLFSSSGVDLPQQHFRDGVHAFAHAMVATAPPGCEIDCDHGSGGADSYSRVLLHDVVAGGGGHCGRIWDDLLGAVEKAVALLRHCPACCRNDCRGDGIVTNQTATTTTTTYDGGCPSCIHLGHCTVFNEGLSRRAGLVIAERTLRRLLHHHHHDASGETTTHKSLATSTLSNTSPRRSRKLRDAHDLVSAKKRHIVVGRPTWPTSDHPQCRDDDIDDDKVASLGANGAPIDYEHEHTGDFSKSDFKYIESNRSFENAGGFLTEDV